MLYEKLLKAFNEELKDIHLRISSPLEEANLVIALCMLPKFVLGDNEKLEIELQELKGSRSVILESKN